MAVLLSPRNADGLPGDPELLLPWILAVFTSILIHELGHAVAFRAHGIPSHIVLYHFGGLAIPDRHGDRPRAADETARSRIIIAFAGPAAQLVSAARLDRRLDAVRTRRSPIGFIADLLPLAPPTARYVEPPILLRCSFCSISMSASTGPCSTCLPVYPLDGGQIAREVFLMFDRGDAMKHSLILSVTDGRTAGPLGFLLGQTFWEFFSECWPTPVTRRLQA